MEGKGERNKGGTYKKSSEKLRERKRKRRAEERRERCSRKSLS